MPVHREVYFFKNYFLQFFRDQGQDVRSRIKWVLDLIREIDPIPEQYFKYIRDGIYEVRVSSGRKIFRVFVVLTRAILLYYFMDSKRRRLRHPVAKLRRLSEFTGSTAKPRRKEKLLTSLDELLEMEHGKKGTPSRDAYEAGYEAFKLGFLLQEARKKKHLTQEHLAVRAGTTKNYISRIENDGSDIRLGTLMRIVKGLGAQLTLTF